MHDLGIIKALNQRAMRKHILKGTSVIESINRIEKLRQNRRWEIFLESTGRKPKEILKEPVV